MLLVSPPPTSPSQSQPSSPRSVTSGAARCPPPPAPPSWRAPADMAGPSGLAPCARARRRRACPGMLLQPLRPPCVCVRRVQARPPPTGRAGGRVSNGQQWQADKGACCCHPGMLLLPLQPVTWLLLPLQPAADVAAAASAAAQQRGGWRWSSVCVPSCPQVAAAVAAVEAELAAELER